MYNVAVSAYVGHKATCQNFGRGVERRKRKVSAAFDTFLRMMIFLLISDGQYMGMLQKDIGLGRFQ